MKKLAVRFLLLIALGLCLMQSLASPAIAVADPTGCGMPYYKTDQLCIFGVFCWDMEREACADCDQGTFCFPAPQ